MLTLKYNRSKGYKEVVRLTPRPKQKCKQLDMGAILPYIMVIIVCVIIIYIFNSIIPA